jgi:retinol dehydrogenase 12
MDSRSTVGCTRLRLENRNVLITGASSGIGKVTARELARLGANIYVAGRSEYKNHVVVDDIRRLTKRDAAHWIPLDLSDLESVRKCAEIYLKLNIPLHLLSNNAGLAGAKGLTKNGFELAFGVNHMGHFLLTQLLLDRLKASAPGRIVTVASRAHRHVSTINWSDLRRPTRSITGIKEYSISKLCNILFGAELARQIEGTGVSTYSLHPGLIDTEIFREIPKIFRLIVKLRRPLTAERGAKTTLYCSTICSQTESGLYYSDSKICLPSTIALDTSLARELWQRSLDWALL